MSVSLERRADRLCEELLRRRGSSQGVPRVIVSPYRVCPLGAHIDHQGGPVVGTAIDAGTLVAFVANDAPHCRVESTNFPGVYEGSLDGDGEPRDWTRYFWAAAQALRSHGHRPARGLHALVEGALPGGGLSSSASVVLAYLSGLAAVNDIALSPPELVQLARYAENEFVGVKCGILDPACIVGSQRDHLVAIDTEACRWEAVAGERAAAESRFLVAFSGVGRNLRDTGFNDRVDQCHEAARRLGELSGHPATKLGNVDEAIFEKYSHVLPPVLARRARHFFGERRRVLDGIEAWQRGDLAHFGHLMNESCRSSIENFEVGSSEIVALHQLMRTTPGVHGTRFSGAGFGGCVVALVASARADACRQEIEDSYRASAPDRSAARVFIAHGRDGLHIR